MSDPPAVDELMGVRVDALFRHDARGRTSAINQWDGGEPPRFYLARTARAVPADSRAAPSSSCTSGPQANLCRVRADVPNDLARALQRLAADEPPLRWVPQSAGGHHADNTPASGDSAPRIPANPPVHQADYARLLGREPDDLDEGGPVYWFDLDRFQFDIRPDRPTVLIDATQAHLLRGGLETWLPDVPHRQPMVAVVEDGRAVSVCASVRITGASHEAGVETVADRRRRGHAVAAVAGWAREVRRRTAAEIFYSTSWRNIASQQVAERLGLTLIGADFSVK